MRRIITWSLKAHKAVVIFAIAVAVFGTIQLRHAQFETLPEFDAPRVVVQTDALGLSAEEVEQLVTVPIEQDLLDGVPWLETIHSKSVPGLSYIEMVFEEGTPLYRARQVVQERISQAAGLPNVSRPPQMLQPQASTSRTAMIALSSKTLTPIQIGVLARFTIRPRLLAVTGVANVAIWGQRERQLQVLVDPVKLREKQVSIEQVVSSTGNALWVSPLTFLEASTPGTGGFIDTANQRLGIQHNLPVIEPKDLATIAIDDTKGVPLTLGDVATVVEDHQPLIGDAVVGDDGRFLIVVEKLPNADTIEVARDVDEVLRMLRPGLLGLDMDSTVFRPTAYLHLANSNLFRSIAVGGVLVAVGLLVLLLRWKKALIALASIVASFLGAATALHLIGLTFNAVVIVGFAVAVGAIVEQSLSDHAESAVPLDAEDAATRRVDGPLREGAQNAAKTAVWATVMFAVAMLPIFFLNGVSGDEFFPPVVIAALVTMASSVFVSMTLTPALRKLLSVRNEPDDSLPTRSLATPYAKVLSVFGKSAIPAVVSGLALLLAGMFVVPSMDKALLPKFKDTNLMVRWQSPYGTSLPEMTRILGRATAELRTVPGVRMVGSQIGQAVGGDRPVGSDAAEMFITVNPDNYSKTVRAITRIVAGYPGFSHRVTTYSAERLRRTLGRTSSEVTVRLFGQDFGDLRTKAEEIRSSMARIRGISQARISSQLTEPTIQVDVDLLKAQALAIKPGDVRRASETLLSGLRVGSLFQDQKIFDVTVWGRPEIRKSVSSVQDLLIDTPNGQVIRLGDVANVTVRPTSPIIEHEDISRYIDVFADVKGRGVGDVRSDVRAALKGIAMPQEFHMTMLSDYSDQQASERRVMAFSMAAIIGVFLLLQAAFRSWRLGAISLLVILASVAGAPLAARVYGKPMSLATVSAIVAVFVVATRFTMRTNERYLALRQDGRPLDSELMADGARSRVGPIVTTCVLTSLAFGAIIVFGLIAGQELLLPMAVAVLGGLLTTVFAQLFVLPPLYLHFGPEEMQPAWNMDELVDTSEGTHADLVRS